jgi:hypothetical protein
MSLEKRPVSFLQICLDANAVRHSRPRSIAVRQQAAGFKTNPFFTMSMSKPRRSAGLIRSGSLRTALALGDLAVEKWWSQTDSNRRPQACKASALPTELWPRRNMRITEARTDCKCAGNHGCSFMLPARMSETRDEWWAWEELNFRPHAYQARALTN